jgi:hypothetical protein
MAACSTGSIAASLNACFTTALAAAIAPCAEKAHSAAAGVPSTSAIQKVETCHHDMSRCVAIAFTNAMRWASGQ